MIRGLGFHARRIEQKIFVTVAIVLAAATAAHAGNVDSHWLLPSDGYWTDPTQWSTNPDYPNNGSPTGTTYDVFVDAAGSPYSVILNSTVTLADLTVNSPDVRVSDNAPGLLNITGTLNVENGTFQITDVATLSNATITTSNGGYFLAHSGTLDNVTVGPSAAGSPTILITDRSNPSTSRGLAFAGGNIVFQGQSPLTSLTLGSSSPLSGNGQIIFQGAGTLMTGGGALTIPSGISIRGVAPFINTSTPFLAFVGDKTQANDVVNNGLVSAENTEITLNLIGNNVVNNGAIQSINNGELTISGTFVNHGTLIENNAILNLNISNFTPAILPQIQRTGGEVNLTSSYDNTGKTLVLDSTTGSLGLKNGGTITGGTINATQGATLHISGPTGILNGVTLAGNMVVEESAAVLINNGLTLQNSTITMGSYTVPPHSENDGALIEFSGSSGLTGSGTILFEKTFLGDDILAQSGGGSVNIGPQITIKSDAAGGRIGYLVQLTVVHNQGTIISGTSGNSISIGGASVVNTGIIRALNGGSLSITNMDNEGIISSLGALLPMVGTITNNGTLSIDSGATLSGDVNAPESFTQSRSGILDFVIGQQTPTTSGLIAIKNKSPVQLGGLLSVEFPDSFLPARGTQWILMSGGTIAGTFDATEFPPLPAGESFDLQYSPNSVVLSVVPEPAPISIVAALLATSLLLRRRRYQQSIHLA